MYAIKSYVLYKPYFIVEQKSRTFKNNSTNFSNTNIFQSYSNSNPNNNKHFPLLKVGKNFMPNLKRSKSYKQSIDYKFYKSLKNDSLGLINKKYDTIFPEVEKSCFNFCKNEEDEMLKRIKRINDGNRKHKILCDIAFKKEIKKKKKNKKFLSEMKLARINFKISKKKVLENQKITNELNNKQKIIKIKNKNLEHPKTTKDIYYDKYRQIFSNKFINNEKKYVIKKEKLMKRFHEIMDKINSKSPN